MSQTTARRQEETAGTQVNSIPRAEFLGVVSPCPRPVTRVSVKNVFLPHLSPLFYSLHTFQLRPKDRTKPPLHCISETKRSVNFTTRVPRIILVQVKTRDGMEWVLFVICLKKRKRKKSINGRKIKIWRRFNPLPRNLGVLIWKSLKRRYRYTLSMACRH